MLVSCHAIRLVARIGKVRVMNCTTCNTLTDKLDMFSGNICLTCWADSSEGKRMVSAQELTRMWGGK